MRLRVCLLCLVLLSCYLKPAYGIEPFSTIGVAVAASSLGYKYFDAIKLKTYCKYAECCNSDVIPHDIISLKEKLDTKLFGQHIVQEMLFKAIASHYERIEESKKPLVMTFHGNPGTGKNYVASMIAEAIFAKGTESKFFHLFHGSQYSDAERRHEHTREIRKEIDDAIDSCPYAIFVFDEVDKMPAGVFDGITSLLDHHTLVRGRDYRKAIFIFLTNIGGVEISQILYQHERRGHKYRHDAKLYQFEDPMKVTVYSKNDGGMKETHLIKAAVIDFYMPFLPLERKHVIECIKEEFKSCTDFYPRQEIIDELIKYIGFDSTTNYAHTGCKTVYAKVIAECK